MTLTLLTPIILLVMASVVTLNAISAYKSGLMKSIINLSVTVASAFAAALVASFGFGSLKDRIAFRITESGFFYEIKDTFGALSSIVNFAVSVLASLILFIPVYVAVIAIAKLSVYLFFRIKTAKTKAKADVSSDNDTDRSVSENASYIAKNNKRLALYVGILCGIFMSIVFLSPITGAFRMASDVIDVAKTFDLIGEEDIDNDVIDSLDRYSNDFLVVAVDSCGGRSLFNVTTLFVYSGEVTNISKELHTLSEMDIAGIFDSLDGKDAFDDEMFSSFRQIIDAADGSPMVKMLLTNLTRQMANNWMMGELFMGFERPDFTSNDITRDLVNEMLKVLSNTNDKTVCEDLSTMLSLVDVFSKHSDTFESDDYEQIINSLVSGNVVDDIKKLINANPRMSVVEAVADDLIMRAVAEEIGDTVRFSDDMRDDLYEKIAEALTSTSEINSSVRADLVSAELNDALSEYGVYTNNGLSEKIAEMLIDSVGSTDGTVDLSDIREYFDQYFVIAE